MLDIPVTILNVILLTIGIYAMFFVARRQQKFPQTEVYVGLVTILYLGLLWLLQHIYPDSKALKYYSISYFLNTGLVIVIFFKIIDLFNKNKEQNKMIKNNDYKKYYDILDSKDIELVKEEDIVWISRLKYQDIQKIFEEDDLFRNGRFVALRKEGASVNEAIMSILHDFPLFYVFKEKRNELPGNEDIWITLKDNDMRLPFCIKNRFNNYISKLLKNNQGDIFKSYIDTSSTANAAIRRMINDGLF